MNYCANILRCCIIKLFLCIFLSSTLLSQEQGKIRKFDEEAKKDTTHTAHSPSSSSSGDVSLTDESFSADVLLFIGEVIGYVVVGTLVQFPGEDSSFHDNTFWTRGFTEYPYSITDKGMFSLDSEKRFAFCFSSHRFSDGNNLSGYGGKLFVSPHQSLNLEAQVIDLSEQQTTKTDHLRLYNFFIDYNRIKSEQFSLWWGLGLKGMNGPTVNKTGFALNSGFEVFPTTPFSMTMNYNIGFINTNSLQEFLFSGNYHINRYNLLAGYQRFTVGDAVLDGMIVGISAHF